MLVLKYMPVRIKEMQTYLKKNVSVTLHEIMPIWLSF